MRVYISGPMRGVPQLNFPAFDAAAATVRQAGWEAVSPADLDRQHVSLPGADYLRDILARDLAALLQCQAIALLPGWRMSEGAVTEIALGCTVKMTFLDSQTLQQITPDVMEWWNHTICRSN